MAGHKTHAYHILPPSIWPFTGAIGAITMLAGAVLWFHDSPPWIALIGVVLILYTMWSWWADVIHEGEVGDHSAIVQIGLRYGMVLFIISEVMFFAAWFWNFFKHALYPAPTIEGITVTPGIWPPAGIEVLDPWHLPLINTLILLCSGCAATWAHHALVHEDDREQVKYGLWLAIVLGALFTMFQAYEYMHAEFAFSGNIYGASFFMATGFHGFHVIIGTIFLAVCLARVYAGHFTSTQHVGFEAAAWYWHFVDVVWLFLFAVIYIWGA
jgi:cytochrome c oxidase subunit 3